MLQAFSTITSAFALGCIIIIHVFTHYIEIAVHAFSEGANCSVYTDKR